MNERIRELAERAMQQVCTERTVKGQIERTWDTARYDQVFAELIINACAMLGDFAQNGGVLKPSVMIKDYFGVKE